MLLRKLSPFMPCHPGAVDVGDQPEGQKIIIAHQVKLVQWHSSWISLEVLNFPARNVTNDTANSVWFRAQLPG